MENAHRDRSPDIIPTKTLIPERRDALLHRPRIVNSLHEHVDLALTLVSAPAGYGKTSLLVDFSHDAPFPVCWLSLDGSDRDLHTFVEYLIAAVRRRFPDFGEQTRHALNANVHPSRRPAAIAGVMVQDLVDHVPEFFALVLDDYHAVDASHDVNQLVEALLKHRPDAMHLILASRTVPHQLPIVLLTARQQISYIGQADLAFTADEVRSLMHQLHDIELTAAQAQELVAESEGWITGILLSRLAMWRGMRNMLAQAQSQDGPVYTFLADQVFSEQPPALQDFMLASSTLQEMNETVCHGALELTETYSTLRELERRGVFLTTVTDADTGTWYRYHHLYREFLQNRLEGQDPDRFRRLHRQAAEWFHANDGWEQAVAHQLLAGDMEAAAGTMEAGAQALFYAGRMETLVSWHQALPRPIRGRHPRLALFVARALASVGRLDEAVPLLDQAETAFAAAGQDEQALLSALQRADLQQSRGQYTAVLPITQAVLSHSTDYMGVSAEAHRLAGIACLNLGQPEQAVEHLEAALDDYRSLGQVREMGLTYVDLSLGLLRLGRLSAGWTAQDKAIERLRQLGPSGELAMLLNNIACERYYLTGDYGPALSHLSEALQVAQACGYPRGQAFALLSTADLYRDLGALAQAAELYARAEAIARGLDDGSLVNFVLNGMAQTRQMAGDLSAALGLAAQARDQAEGREDIYQRGLSALTLGAIHLDLGALESALAEVEQGCDLLAQSGARRDLTRGYILLARARQAIGDPEGALQALDQALEIGTQTQTFHYLVIEGQRAFDLLRRLRRRNPADRRLDDIMDRIRRLPEVARETIGAVAPEATPHPTTLRFCGFGPGIIEKDGEQVPANVWRSAIARYLTFYLLLHAPCSRDEITETFWPDLSREKAGATFHWVKHQIHHALGRPLVVHEEGLYHVAWDPDCWFDVTTFEALLNGREGRQARLAEAVSLYQGDFMEGHDAEWCTAQRERLRLRYRDALIELGELYTTQAAYERGFAVLSRALGIDDLHEPASRALMRLYARDGRRPAALKHYHNLRRRLQAELGASPAPETEALFTAIRNAAEPARLDF